MQAGQVAFIFVQLAAGFLDFPLKRLILVNANIAPLEGRRHLLLCGFQCGELFLCLADGLRQKLLLLRHQDRIGRVELQQPVYIIERRLCFTDGRIDTL